MNKVILLVLIFIAACKSPNNSTQNLAVLDHSNKSHKAKIKYFLNNLSRPDIFTKSLFNEEKFRHHFLDRAQGMDAFNQHLNKYRKKGLEIEVIRLLQDGDYVVSHSIYKSDVEEVVFDVFRFEGQYIVEHWNNTEVIKAKNKSGRTQTDGPTLINDLDKTASNKDRAFDYLTTLLVDKNWETIDTFFEGGIYYQHNTSVEDGVHSIKAVLKNFEQLNIPVGYKKIHKIVGEGNFVFTISEGYFDNKPIAYFDMLRIENNKIKEHWDVIEEIETKTNWKNPDGKF